MKDERLSVTATFNAGYQQSSSVNVIAFGWDEAREKADELREWVRTERNQQCKITIVPDHPDENRSAFHGA